MFAPPRWHVRGEVAHAAEQAGVGAPGDLGARVEGQGRGQAVRGGQVLHHGLKRGVSDVLHDRVNYPIYQMDTSELDLVLGIGISVIFSFCTPNQEEPQSVPVF